MKSGRHANTRLTAFQTGFEFRKHRSMPKLTGVVVASENEDLLLAALEEDQHMTAEKEHIKKQERLFRNWKKLLNSLKIQARLQREYGEKLAGEQAVEEHGDEEQLGEQEGLEAYRNVALDESAEQPAGGFVVD